MGLEAVVRELSNYYLKRRLDGGAYVFYSLASKTCLEGRKSVIKDLQSEEIMGEIKNNSNSSDIGDKEFESLLLKAIVQLPFEKQFSSQKFTKPKVAAEKNISETSSQSRLAKSSSSDNLGFTYEVITDPRNVDNNEIEKIDEKLRSKKFRQILMKPKSELTAEQLNIATEDDWKQFFKKFENLVHVQKILVTKLSKKAKLKNTVFKGIHILTFPSEENAKQFLQKKIFCLKQISYSAEIRKKCDNEKYLKHQWLNFSRFAKRMSCYIREFDPDTLAKQIWVNKMQYVSDEAVQEFFCGVETEFEGIVDVKRVVYELLEKEGKLVPKYILTFESKDMLDKFSKKKQLAFNGNSLEYFAMGGLEKKLRVGSSVKNFDDDPKNICEISMERKIAVIMSVNNQLEEEYIKKCFTSENSIFIGIEDIHRCQIHDGFSNNFSGVYILTFKNEEQAKNAIYLEPAKTGDIYLSYIAPLKEYFDIRRKLIEEIPLKLPEEGKKIVKIVPSENSITFKTSEIPKGTFKHIDTQTELSKEEKIRKLRYFREKHELDLWIGCFGIRGTQVGIEEVQEYFEQNHENVEEVTSYVQTSCTTYFVKFKDIESAETFLCLPYTKFRGQNFDRKDTFDHVKKLKFETEQRNVVELLVGKVGIPIDKFEHKIELSGFTKMKFDQLGISEYFVKMLNIEPKEVYKLIGDHVWDVMSENPTRYKILMGMKCDGSKALDLVQQWNFKKIQNSADDGLITASLVFKDGTKSKKGIKREFEEGDDFEKEVKMQKH